jgi:outer membrane biosynthesis protein TonB
MNHLPAAAVTLLATLTACWSAAPKAPPAPPPAAAPAPSAPTAVAPTPVADPEPATTTPPLAALSRDDLLSGMATIRPRLLACGNLAVGVHGIVKVHVAIDTTGSVSSAQVLPPSIDPAITKCVESLFASAVFARTEGGGSFTYPLVF